MSWTVGRHRVTFTDRSNKRIIYYIAVDDELPQMHTWGTPVLKVGELEAHVYVGPELRLGEHRIPHSPDWLAQERAPKDTVCAGHAGGGSYRSAPAAVVRARYICPVCDKPVCAACVAPDRVMCHACFEAAHREDQHNLDNARKARSMVFSILAMLTGVIVIAGALDLGNRAFAGVALALFAFGAIRLVVELRRPRLPRGLPWEAVKERRDRAHRTLPPTADRTPLRSRPPAPPQSLRR